MFAKKKHTIWIYLINEHKFLLFVDFITNENDAFVTLPAVDGGRIFTGKNQQ